MTRNFVDLLCIWDKSLLESVIKVVFFFCARISLQKTATVDRTVLEAS